MKNTRKYTGTKLTCVHHPRMVNTYGGVYIMKVFKLTFMEVSTLSRCSSDINGGIYITKVIKLTFREASTLLRWSRVHLRGYLNYKDVQVDIYGGVYIIKMFKLTLIGVSTL